MEWRVSAALTAGGVKPGDVSLHVGRHYSIRDLITWGNRMQVIPTVCQQLIEVRTFCVKCKASECVSLTGSILHNLPMQCTESTKKHHMHQ